MLVDLWLNCNTLFPAFRDQGIFCYCISIIYVATMLAPTQTHKQPSHWFVCNVTNHYCLPIVLFTLIQISKNHHKQVLSSLGGEFTLFCQYWHFQYDTEVAVFRRDFSTIKH